MLPQELGCGSGMSCWRCLRDWQRAGIWQLIHFVLLDWLARREKLIGREPLWTAGPFEQFLGAEDRSQPYGSRQAGQQAPFNL